LAAISVETLFDFNLMND